ncbi:MAG: NACHT domain-containing protein [Alphaproteobacteria bacterium]
MEVRRLSELLPQGREGGNEFARIVDLLLFFEARQDGRTLTLFSDRAGDWGGLDSFEDGGNVGYQYKFFPSPLSSDHRREIADALAKCKSQHEKTKIKKVIIVTPDDLVESSHKKGGGDVTWFRGLKASLSLPFDIEHFGHRKLQGLFAKAPALCLRYYPELVPEGSVRRNKIEETRRAYVDGMLRRYGRIEFVGMSVRKEEATRGVEMGNIYIPLATIAEVADTTADGQGYRTNPLEYLEAGRRTVILGDPGSGKSTLLRFMALVGHSERLQKRCDGRQDGRLPVLVTLRRYSDELKSNVNLSLIDYIKQSIYADFSIPFGDNEFISYYLETCQAIILFDGVDELPDVGFKRRIRERVEALATMYPRNTILVTSRIVGYESEARFSGDLFHHCRVAPLLPEDMRRFASEWYAERVEDDRERRENVDSLMSVLTDPDSQPIRDLATNPLLLTIIVLVHRVDAVLPDQRVLLYEKCVETLLITWYVWKYRETIPKKRGVEDRRNQRRMEAIAQWMHEQAGGSGHGQRAVVVHDDLVNMLAKHMQEVEKTERAQAEESAEEFLSFVRDKAGLLVEAGAERYSFVHLTFQEYLTARHINTRSEGEGDPFVWEVLKDRIRDPRWSEVTRLLIAARRSEESQERLLAHILDEEERDRGRVLTGLLGGVLLDRVPAAEERHEDILFRILMALATRTDESTATALVPLLRAVTMREANADAAWEAAMEKAWQDLSSGTGRANLVLAAYATRLPEQRFLPWVERLESEGSMPDMTGMMRWLLRGVESAVNLPGREAFWSDLFSVLRSSVLTDSFHNFSAAAQVALFPSAAPIPQADRIFRLQLACLIGGSGGGPFYDFTRNMLAAVKERPGLGFDPARDRDRDRARDRVRVRRWTEWSLLIAEQVIAAPLLEDISTALQLEPQPLWIEALRIRLLPGLPDRLYLFQPDVQRATIDSLRDGRRDGTSIFTAAALLMVDIWLYLFGHYDIPVDSPFSELAAVTVDVDSPVLRFVHCLRDLAFGDESRTDNLVRMVRNPRPELRSVLTEALWIE